MNLQNNEAEKHSSIKEESIGIQNFEGNLLSIKWWK